MSDIDLQEITPVVMKNERGEHHAVVVIDGRRWAVPIPSKIFDLPQEHAIVLIEKITDQLRDYIVWEREWEFVH